VGEDFIGFYADLRKFVNINKKLDINMYIFVKKVLLW